MPSILQMLRGILPAQRRPVTLHGLVIRSEAKDLCNLFVSDSQGANKKARAVRLGRAVFINPLVIVWHIDYT
jgi:hypothetical protein